MRRLIMLGVAASGLLMMIGCAASGADFRPTETLANDKALVYIYRPDSMLGGGKAIRYDVTTKEGHIVEMIRGGYFPYEATPGETTFWAWTESKVSVTNDLAAGKTYYLKCGLGWGVFIGRPTLEFVDEEQGMKELKDTVLLPAANRKKSDPTMP
jgi:hypothetical protein